MDKEDKKKKMTEPSVSDKHNREKLSKPLCVCQIGFFLIVIPSLPGGVLAYSISTIKVFLPESRNPCFFSLLFLHGLFMAMLTACAILWFWLELLKMAPLYFFWNVCVFWGKYLKLALNDRFVSTELECIFLLFTKRCHKYAPLSLRSKRWVFKGKKTAQCGTNSMLINL